MLAPVTEADFGERDLLALNVEGRALWGGFAAELEQLTGRPAGYADSGCLVVAADRDDAAELRRLHEYQLELGLEAEWLTPSAARGLEPGLSPRIGGAISVPGDGQVEPRAVVAALAAALAAAGGELAEGTEVAELTGDADRVHGIRTAAGEEIAAGHVLVACGAWSGQPPFAAEPGAPAVRPVKGQLLELRTTGGQRPFGARLVRTPRCYVVCRDDGRVVIGATTEERGFDTAVTADGVFRLLEAAIEVLPDVARAGADGHPRGPAAGHPGRAAGDRRRPPRRTAVGNRPRPQRRAPGPADRQPCAGSAGREGGRLMPTVTINGIQHDLPAEATVADAVRAAGAPEDGRGVAVALGGEVVPRGRWGQRRLSEGEQVEVLHAVQGG